MRPVKTDGHSARYTTSSSFRSGSTHPPASFRPGFDQRHAARSESTITCTAAQVLPVAGRVADLDRAGQEPVAARGAGGGQPEQLDRNHPVVHLDHQPSHRTREPAVVPAHRLREVEGRDHARHHLGRRAHRRRWRRPRRSPTAGRRARPGRPAPAHAFARNRPAPARGHRLSGRAPPGAGRRRSAGSPWRWRRSGGG